MDNGIFSQNIMQAEGASLFWKRVAQIIPCIKSVTLKEIGGRTMCRTALLERCLRRLEFEKAKEAEDKAAAEQIEAERAAMQSVDW